MPGPTLSTFSLFAPPYREYLAIDGPEGFASNPEVLRGVALIWNMEEGHGPAELDVAAERPGGVPLMVVLPRAQVLRKLQDRVLEVVEEARPQSILPFHPRPDPEEMASLLRREPVGLAGEFLDFLRWRGLHMDPETRRLVRKIVEMSTTTHTLSGLARGIYLSRRALGRRFQQRGLPVPSHWLQFCRILRVAIRVQNSDESLHAVARGVGYPDGFTLSNQAERLVGVRPSVIRQRLGWEWVAEAWLSREALTGGLQVALRGIRQGRRPRESGQISPHLHRVSAGTG